MMSSNLGSLIVQAATAYGDDVAFQIRRGFRKERLSYREVGQRARQVAAYLLARGLLPGDRIAVWSPNMPEYAVLFFGAWMAGIVMVPIDVRTRPEVVERFAATAGARLGVRSRYLEAGFGGAVTDTLVLEELFALVEGAPLLDPLPAVSQDDLAEIAFTSGTTGLPKGVKLSHGNFLAEIAAMQQAFPLKRSYRALSLLPLSHAFEQVVNLLLAFTSGVRMTYVPRVNAVTIARALREEKITSMVLVPQLLRLVLNGIERRAQNEGRWRQWQLAHRVAPYLATPLRRLLFRQVHAALGGHLEFFGCGSAPLDLKLARAWENMGIALYEGYGLTETTAAATINNRHAKRLGSVGRPIPGVEVRIAEDGEILIRGATVTSGYYQDEARTKQAFVDGWFRSGDIGRIDGDGFLHIAGRDALKIVLADGHKVYPEDLERVLDAHPLVVASCVVGLPRQGAEIVHAALITRQPDRVAEIVRDANRQLADHQQILDFSVWPEEDFPRTPILKIDRNRVKAALAHTTDRAVAAESSPPTVHADPVAGLVARIVERPVTSISDAMELGTDLAVDSIARVELLSLVEEELGKVVDELAVTPQTTVGELRELIEKAGASVAAPKEHLWQRAWWARLLGEIVFWIACRIQDRWMRFTVVHPERLARLPYPSILIFNYQAPYAPLAILRALPGRLRRRTAVAVDARVFQGRDRWQGILVGLACQGFPFVKTGGAVRASLEELGRWLDDGYAVIMSPEGQPEPDGQVLPFLGGTGLMAVEMRAPIVPFWLDGYHTMFPKVHRFPFLPNRRGSFRLVVGEPLRLPANISYHEATERAREALIATGASG